MRFVTGGVEKMRINSVGKTGIGINYESPIALYVGGNDALHIPSGTTTQRPTATSTTEQGYIRWNSEKQIFEGFGLKLAWGPLSAGASETNSSGNIVTGIDHSSYPHIELKTDEKTRMKIWQTGNISVGGTGARVIFLSLIHI